MKKILLLTLALIVTGLNAEAQTAQVSSQEALVAALQDEDMRQLIQLTGDINLTTAVTIPAGVTTQIDLNEHTLNRGLTESAADGQVFHIKANATLTLSGLGGVITGGYAENGGAILNEGTLIIHDITLSGNHAVKNGGAIWNGGNLTLNSASLTGNNAVEGGGLYNSQNASCTIDGAAISGNSVNGKGGGIANYGNITFLGGSILNNHSFLDGGGVYVAKDATFVMTGGEIKENRSDLLSSGIYVQGVLEMQGSVKVTENYEGNVFLAGFSVIQVTGAFEDNASIGVTCEMPGTVTQGYSTYNPSLEYTDIFSADRNWLTLSFEGGEVVQNQTTGSLVEFYYSYWDDEAKVVKQLKRNYETPTPLEDQTNLSGWYVVKKNYTNSSSRVTINDDTNIILQDGATLTLTKGIYVKDGKTLTIYGQQEGTGHLKCSAVSGNAGIGGNKDVVAGYVVIHGGTVTASGDDDGAGIGGGYGDGSGIRGITIYGGIVTANGMNGGAGIGKGKNNNVWEDIRIYGGKIEAIGGYLGSGIGGSYNRGNGNIWIYGGHIEAYLDLNGMLFNIWMEKHAGAGIGGGRDANQDRPINIYGGTIFAEGIGGAGIGGGSYGNGGEINIYGGNVTATISYGGRGSGIGGGNEGKGGRVYIADEATVNADKSWVESTLIGHGKDNSDNGTLKLGDNLMAYYLKADDSKDYHLSGERVDKCRGGISICLTKCTHPSGFTYTANEYNHTAHCKHCLYTEKHEHEFSAESGECICGLKNSENTLCEITIATVNGSNDYYEAVVSGGVVKDQPFTIPSCDREPDGYVFAGWLVTDTNADPPQKFEVQPGEELLQPGDTYTPTGNTMLWARYDGILLTLDADDTSTSTIEEFAGKKASTVWLKNRTFYTDGDWNTLCLPFDIPDFTGTHLEGATVKTLVSSSFDNTTGTLTLNFSDDLTSIEAGKPYLVKWTNSSYSSINYPAFDFGNITIRADLTGVTTDDVAFRGHFNKIDLTKGDTSVLYLGGGNTLYYPNGDDMFVKGFSCVFELQEGLVAGDLATGQTNVSNFKLNFGDGSDITGVTLPLINQSGAGDDMWYDLQGRRLSGKPTAKGIYISNGKKVIM